MRTFIAMVALVLGVLPDASIAQLAGKSAGNVLRVVHDGQPLATVVVAPDAGPMEKDAAADLVKYVALMTGAKLPIAPVRGSGPAIFVGKAALSQDASLSSALLGAAKKDPFVNADAIALRRLGDSVYVAGNNDQSHHFAVSKLLQEWGCRWYMPTDFGEVVPEHRSLAIGDLNVVHGSPFEVRNFWLAWRADPTGSKEFQRRNFGSTAIVPGRGHALGKYTKNLVPAGKSKYDVSLAEAATAAEVVARIEDEYAKGVPGISLAIEDGLYRGTSQADLALQGRIFDKYMLAPSQSDALITLYNNVSRTLQQKYPQSPTKIGGLAYFNVTLPPQQVTHIEPNVVMWLAAIDIDPNHGMDDPNSPPRQELKGMMYRWAELLKGRLAIYDYDQAQLIWRDLPNPSHHVFARDVQHYRKAGILGVSTESRGATATTFLNLHIRLQLLWNPDADVESMLAEFYPAFYGPAAAPMKEYWDALFEAWSNTLVTEHEYVIAPAIYTPELIGRLRMALTSATRSLEPLRSKDRLTRNETRYLERLQFTQLSFAVIENYMEMVRLASAAGDYKAAAAAGEKGLAAREQLTRLNPTFTTYRPASEKGPHWFPGEVQQMREFSALTDGTKGTLVAKLPLEWAFRRDPSDTGLPRGWSYQKADLKEWVEAGQFLPSEARRNYPDYWETVRTDLYLQAQGIRNPDAQSYTGHYWYQAELDLDGVQNRGSLHLLFPGVFNELWLYINGRLVAHRPASEPWWRAPSQLTWDVDVTQRLQSGKNLISIRGLNPHHFGGLFRRPFLYRAATP